MRTERAAEPAGVRVDARPAASDTGAVVDEPVGVTQAEATNARAAQAAQAASSARSAGATMVERILEAATRLENQPPPRTLTLELGDARVRLSMADGTLRLSLLGEPGAEDRDLLQDASEQLRNRGFDLGDGRDESESGGEHAGASASGQRRGATSAAPTTGVAGRSTTDLRL